MNIMVKTTTRNIGIDVPMPKKACEGDKHCPFHGSKVLRGKQITGKVVRVNLGKTALIELERRVYVPKYERYQKRRTRLWVHNPECVEVEVTDMVKVMETRKISKTKNFVIIANLSKEQ